LVVYIIYINFVCGYLFVYNKQSRCRQAQQILLVMSVHAACFCRDDHPEALST